MFAKVVLFCAALVAAHAQIILRGAAVANTGISTTSRQQDSFGNYAYGYNVVDGYAARKSHFEVGDAYGNKGSSYSSHVNHLAPLAVARPVVPLAVARHHSPIAMSAPLPVAHAAPIPVKHHSVPVAVAHSTPLAVPYAAPFDAYSTQTAINHISPVAVSPVATARFPVGLRPLPYTRIPTQDQFGYGFGGVPYGDFRSVY